MSQWIRNGPFSCVLERWSEGNSLHYSDTVLHSVLHVCVCPVAIWLYTNPTLHTYVYHSNASSHSIIMYIVAYMYTYVCIHVRVYYAHSKKCMYARSGHFMSDMYKSHPNTTTYVNLWICFENHVHMYVHTYMYITHWSTQYSNNTCLYVYYSIIVIYIYFVSGGTYMYVRTCTYVLLSDDAICNTPSVCDTMNMYYMYMCIYADIRMYSLVWPLAWMYKCTYLHTLGKAIQMYVHHTVQCWVRESKHYIHAPCCYCMRTYAIVTAQGAYDMFIFSTFAYF